MKTVDLENIWSMAVLYVTAAGCAGVLCERMDFAAMQALVLLLYASALTRIAK